VDRIRLIRAAWRIERASIIQLRQRRSDVASQAPEIHTDDGTDGPQLKRSLSPPITIYGLGTMIGAGCAGLFAPVSPT